MFKFAFSCQHLTVSEKFILSVCEFCPTVCFECIKVFFSRKSVFSSKITLILVNSFNNWIVESALDLFALVNFHSLLSCN